MTRLSFRAPAAALAAALVIAAPAQAACWSGEDVAAAKVRDMGMLIATVSARCEAAGLGTAAERDGYAAAARRGAGVANQRLKARFWTIAGAEAGQRDYDIYVAALAAPYARVPVVAENCAQVASLATRAAAAGATLSGLAAVADREGFTPALPGGVCKVDVVAYAARAFSTAP